MYIEVIDFLKALLTPVIAGVTVYIAMQQLKTNQQKLRLELYDRRLRVYEEVKKILTIILRDANASIEDLYKFRNSVTEADFLFGPEIIKYIDEIYKRGCNLHNWNAKYRDYTQKEPKGYDHTKVVDGRQRETKWLTEQFEPAKEKFNKYLNVRK